MAFPLPPGQYMPACGKAFKARVEGKKVVAEEGSSAASRGESHEGPGSEFKDGRNEPAKAVTRTAKVGQQAATRCEAGSVNAGAVNRAVNDHAGRTDHEPGGGYDSITFVHCSHRSGHVPACARRRRGSERRRRWGDTYRDVLYRRGWLGGDLFHSILHTRLAYAVPN